jgi:hypothetical protein
MITDSGYVAVMVLRQQIYAIRGAEAIGPFTALQATEVGNRLQNEIAGTCVRVCPAENYTPSEVPLRRVISAAEYIKLAGGDRTLRQYKADPLVIEPLPGV